MSNTSITRVDTKLLGEHEAQEGEISQQDAQNSLVSANLGEGISLTQIKSRTKVGRFVGAEVSGYVMAVGVWGHGLLERAAKKLDDDLQASTDPAQNVLTASALTGIVNSAAGLAAVQLKSAEIMAHGRGKKRKQSNAPQMTITGQHVQVNNNAPAIASQTVKH